MSTPPDGSEGSGGDGGPEPWDSTPPPPPGGHDPGAFPPPGTPPSPGTPTSPGQPPPGGQPPAWGQSPPSWSGGPPATGYVIPTNGLAVGGLVASIVGLLTLWLCGIGVIGVVVGLVLGYVARGQIRASGGQQGGEGIAMAAIVVGWIGAGLTALWFVMVFIFGLFGALAPMGM